MAYTPDNNPYIPGDPYSYDLKWQVENIKHLQTRFGELDETIQEATDQADRAEQEADRAAGRADFATEEADRATNEADRSAQQADNAAASAEAAADSAEAAADSEAAAKNYADNIADPVAGLVADWLATHITQPTTPAIDTSLTVAGAAADAAVTGDNIRAIKSLLQQLNNPHRIDMNIYDSDYQHYSFKVIGFNTKIIIDPNGGTLYERVGSTNIPIVPDVPIIVDGTHTYRVYKAQDANVPHIYVDSESWLGGYPTASDLHSWHSNAARATRFIEIAQPTDIEGALLEVVLNENNIGTGLFGPSNSYTAHAGNYYVIVRESNGTDNVTGDTIKNVKIEPVKFPKLTGEAFYEKEMYSDRLNTGAQGICATESKIVQFTGTGWVYEYDLNGNFINRIAISNSIGHCNSATYFNGQFYVVESALPDPGVYILDSDYSIINFISVPLITGMAYSDDGYFYYLTATRLDNFIAADVDLHRCDTNFTSHTLIQSTIMSDNSYILQGMEIQGDTIIVVMLTSNYQGILAYYSKTGTLLKWRYVERQAELEDVAINNDGVMFISYQHQVGNTYNTLMTKLENIVRFNASENAKDIATGVTIGNYKDPLIITADSDHAIINGSISGNIVQNGNLARVTANILPHVSYKYINGAFICVSGSPATNNRFLPLLYIPAGSGNTITFNDVYLNLKNNRWFTSAL